MIQSTINLRKLEADVVLRNAVAQHEKDKGASGQRFTATQKRTVLDKAVVLSTGVHFLVSLQFAVKKSRNDHAAHFFARFSFTIL